MSVMYVTLLCRNIYQKSKQSSNYNRNLVILTSAIENFMTLFMYFGKSAFIMNKAQSCAIWPIINPHMGPEDNMAIHGADFNLLWKLKLKRYVEHFSIFNTRNNITRHVQSTIIIKLKNNIIYWMSFHCRIYYSININIICRNRN